MAIGNVYIFNTYPNEGITLVLNNYYLGTLASAVNGTYAPTSTSVARNPASGDPGVAQFGGKNTLIISYGSGGTSHSFDISGIAFSQVPGEDDLQLYIFYNLAILVTQSNAAPVPITGATLSAAEAAQVRKLLP